MEIPGFFALGPAEENRRIIATDKQLAVYRFRNVGSEPFKITGEISGSPTPFDVVLFPSQTIDQILSGARVEKVDESQIAIGQYERVG